MPKNRRMKQREREKLKRAKKRESFNTKGTEPVPGAKIFNGVSDLTPNNALKVIRNKGVDPEEVIDFGGRKWIGH